MNDSVESSTKPTNLGMLPCTCNAKCPQTTRKRGGKYAPHATATFRLNPGKTCHGHIRASISTKTLNLLLALPALTFTHVTTTVVPPTARTLSSQCTLSAMAPASKKRKVAAIPEISFDPAAREEYLTGFHKRKLARQKLAEEENGRKERAEKLRFRAEVRWHI
jgi:hypothetical protein